ncbi:MAG: hypothetical protein Fur009_7470 [Candidatus Microgenomates bacterium]
MEESILKREGLQRVTRSFIITLAPHEEIYSFLTQTDQNQTEKNEFSFLRFILAKKNSQEKGGERLTFFGGKVNLNEDLIEATQRKVVEEIGFSFIPIGKALEGKNKLKTLHNLSSFGYSFDDLQREVILNAFYMNPQSISLITDQKISEFVQVDLEHLRKLINGEILNGLQLEEHLRVDIFEESGLFLISKQDNDKRKSFFEKALGGFDHIDNYLKRRFGQIFVENPEITLEEFKKRYEQELIRFLANGLRLSLPGKEIKIDEEGVDSQRQKDARVIFEGLNGGFLGTDVLYFLPHIAHLIIQEEDPEKFLNAATETTLSFWRYFKGIYEEFLRTYDKSYENFTILEKKVRFIEEFDKFAIQRLKQNFELTDEEIKLTFSHFNGFWSELEQDLKNADSELTKGLTQNYRLLNEVANAPFGRLILIFLGIDRYSTGDLSEEEKISFEKLQKKLIFEAGRQILLLMKGFLSVSHFEEGSQAENMLKVNSAVEAYFGPAVKNIKIDEGQSVILAEIRNKWGKYFVVDEKPGKRWISFIRKIFKEKFDDVVDFLSYSIVYLGENKEEFIKKLNDGTFKTEFLNYLREQFPRSRISLEEKYTFGLENFIKGLREYKGKRTGSQGKRIVAKKFILKIDDQITEIVMYPYSSTKEAGIDENGFWIGWLEKRKDDSDYVIKRMLAGENGVPSFYDLLFPPDIYPEQYKHRLQATYHL